MLHKLLNRKYDNIIDKGTMIVGNVAFRSPALVRGFIEGNIDSSDILTVGKNGQCIKVRSTANVEVSGTVDKGIITTGTVKITKTGRVYGDVECSELVIEPGGILQGMSKIRKKLSNTAVANPVNA